MFTLYLPDVVGLIGLAINAFVVAHFVHEPAVLWRIYLMMAGTVLVLIAFRSAQTRLGQNHRLHRTFDWWVMLAGLSVYLNIHDIVDAVGRPLFDDWLMGRDQALFGGQAALTLSSHVNLWVTDIEFFFYTTYYGWIAITGMVLARYDRRAFTAYLAALGASFFLMLWGYMAVPAIGPRYTQAVLMHAPLVGHWFGNYMRDSFNEVIFIKDCFPSGHTLQTLVATYFACRYLPRICGAVMAVAAVLIIFSTLYCRMHYAFDLLGATPIAVGSIFLGERYGRRLHAWTFGERKLLTNLWPY